MFFLFFCSETKEKVSKEKFDEGLWVFAQLPRWLLAQLPLGLTLRCCSIASRALSLCSRSSREGFSFLLPEQKKRNKENSPSALFCLLRYFSTLNKKNSLRSNSFLFFTLRKAPPLYGKKVRPDLTAFSQHRFARFLSSRAERSEVKDLVYIHTTSEAMCPPKRAISGLSGGA